MSPVLVTGGNGYLGTQLVATLLRDGREVRATVRALDREAGLGARRCTTWPHSARWPSG
jgi:uncharacterized protein YbjT (DUF2867 family)